MTLSLNMKTVTGHAMQVGMEQAILSHEVYRPELLKWLQEAQAHDWEVHLFTVRKTCWQEPTLANIQKRTGWVPDQAWFNDTGIDGSKAYKVKQTLFNRVVETCSPSHLYGLESNSNVHKLYSQYGVGHQRGDKPLPTFAKLDLIGRWQNPSTESPNLEP